MKESKDGNQGRKAGDHPSTFRVCDIATYIPPQQFLTSVGTF